MKYVALVAAVALLLLTGPAAAAQCDLDLAEVDAALNSNPQIDADLLLEAIARRDQGAAFCADGNDQEAIQVLASAKFILGLYAGE